VVTKILDHNLDRLLRGKRADIPLFEPNMNEELLIAFVRVLPVSFKAAVPIATPSALRIADTRPASGNLGTRSSRTYVLIYLFTRGLSLTAKASVFGLAPNTSRSKHAPGAAFISRTSHVPRLRFLFRVHLLNFDFRSV
jgi:hypothetical protein